MAEGWSSQTVVNPTQQTRLIAAYNDVQEPAGSLFVYGAGDYSSYSAQAYIGYGSGSLRLSLQYAADEFPKQTVFVPDEDFWFSPVQPTLANLRYPQPWAFHQDEVSTFSNQLDEDYWPLAPLQQMGALPPQPAPVIMWFGDDCALIFLPEEDLWPSQVVNLTPPDPGAYRVLQQFRFVTDEFSGIQGQPDEDFWVSGVPPVALSMAYPQQWIFDEQLPTGTLLGLPEEDLWQNRVAPVQMTYYLRLPYALGWDTRDDIVPISPGPTPPSGRSARFGFGFPHFR